MFEAGTIVKSVQRTEKFPLFLMVLHDPNPSPTQFNAVVLFEKSKYEIYQAGEVLNNWNKDSFEKSSWDELKKYV